MNDKDYPSLYRSANKLSSNSQSIFFWVLGTNLITLIIAAFLSALNFPDQFLAYTQTIILLLSLGCNIFLGATNPEKLWYGGRALAESLKTITWRYMMRAEPYHDSDAEADEKIIDVLHKIVEENNVISKLAPSINDSYQITQHMRNVRSETFSARIERYLKERIIDQLDWYTNKANLNRRNKINSFYLLCFFNSLAVICAFLRIQFSNWTIWPTDIFIAIAASITAWIQAKRYQELYTSYSLASTEISIVREKLALVNTEEGFSKYVGDSENAFSREHTQWIARRDT